MSKKARFLAQISGISLNSTSQEEVLREIVERLGKDKQSFIVTPNPEFIVYAQKHPWFKKILNQADFAIPDGVGLVWAGKILSQPIQERISGTDLMEKLCQKAAQKGWPVYLIGGQPGIAKKAFQVLQKRYPGLKGWAKSGPKLELTDDDWTPMAKKKIPKIIREINAKEPDLLFVALGMGKQEKFIWENRKRLKAKLMMGVGGAFDYLGGQVPRAPKWMQKVGLEWLFRLIREPWRGKRQLALLEFIGLVIREKLT